MARDVVLRGVVLRGLGVELQPGEWYEGYDREPSPNSKTIRLGDVDRIETRLRGNEREMWVSGHKETCPDRPDHESCIAEYIALRAVERAVAKRDGQP
ncbi:hypothetical protein ACI2K4_30755 [Micromonospora sp. NPDC050397]|uniref:hypothetical protein n=1 Tax=Micromonospora sp. NPDC050397 TaxID=3364279 RepID=UPI00384CEBD0